MSIKKLTSRHEAIMRRIVLDGCTRNEVCEEFDIKPASLSVISSTPIWRDKEDSMRREAFEKHKIKLESLTDKAISALDDCVKSEREDIKLRSAKEILDRTGFVPGIKVDMDVNPTIKLYVPKNWNNSDEDDVIDITSGSV